VSPGLLVLDEALVEPNRSTETPQPRNDDAENQVQTDGA
jgi:hypothetical protein